MRVRFSSDLTLKGLQLSLNLFVPSLIILYRFTFIEQAWERKRIATKQPRKPTKFN